MELPIRQVIDKYDLDFKANHQYILSECEQVLDNLSTLKSDMKTIIKFLKSKYPGDTEVGYNLIIKYMNNLMVKTDFNITVGLTDGEQK